MGRRDVICYMCLEGVAGQGANDVATCVKNDIVMKANSGVKEIVFYTDG